MKENVFIRNLKKIYEYDDFSVFTIKRMARSDLRFEDITQEEYDSFIAWIDEQEELKNTTEDIEEFIGG